MQRHNSELTFVIYSKLDNAKGGKTNWSKST